MILLAAAAPLEPGRELARQWARQELSDPAYARARPGLATRALRWLLDRLAELDLHPSSLQPPVALVLLAVLVAAVAVVLGLRHRRLRGVAAAPDAALFADGPATSAEHRRRADAAAAENRWDEAVRERFRAVVRTLDERAVLEDRPGRTADEAAAEAARRLPDLADRLRAGAALFDGVTYGDRPAGPGDDEGLRELDAAVTAARAQHRAAV